jgi:hypothetical protein
MKTQYTAKTGNKLQSTDQLYNMHHFQIHITAGATKNSGAPRFKQRQKQWTNLLRKSLKMRKGQLEDANRKVTNNAMTQRQKDT